MRAVMPMCELGHDTLTRRILRRGELVLDGDQRWASHVGLGSAHDFEVEVSGAQRAHKS